MKHFLFWRMKMEHFLVVIVDENGAFSYSVHVSVTPHQRSEDPSNLSPIGTIIKDIKYVMFTEVKVLFQPP
jgi:hypothetical protein